MSKKKAKKRPGYQKKPREAQKQQNYLFWSVIAIAVIGVLALIWWGSRPPKSSGASASAEGMSMGPKNAPVQMDIYTDFQCPFCGRFERETLPKLEQNYVKSGKLRITVHLFSFLGDESIWATEAAYCANDQGKFWPYHDKLFNSQAGENQGAFSVPHLKAFAKELGLNTKTFNDCLDSHRYKQAVLDARDKASQRGVRSTPTIYINDKQILGAQPYQVFAQAIDEALKKK